MKAVVPACVLLLIVLAALCSAAPAPAPQAEWKEAGGTKVPVPPHVHPRLYLGPQQAAQLKARLENPVLRPVAARLEALAKKDAQSKVEWDALQYLAAGDAGPAEGMRVARPQRRLPRDRTHDGHRRDRLRLALPAARAGREEGVHCRTRAPRQDAGVRLSAQGAGVRDGPCLGGDDHARHDFRGHRRLRRVPRDVRPCGRPVLPRAPAGPQLALQRPRVSPGRLLRGPSLLVGHVSAGPLTSIFTRRGPTASACGRATRSPTRPRAASRGALTWEPC
jgi:hypothetical protein